MKDYLKALGSALKAEANPKDAAYKRRYMRNQFDYYGMMTPKRREIFKAHWKKYGRPPKDQLFTLVKNCWELPQREYQHFGWELAETYKKEYRPEDKQLIEYMTINKSWWDTVDMIGMRISGDFFKCYPDLARPYTADWMKSGNMWLQRISLIFQLKYKEQTDSELLFDYCRQLSHSDEFFIQKAIGWVLRQYAKTAPKQVVAFVSQTPLKPLSEREALRRIRNQQS